MNVTTPAAPESPTGLHPQIHRNERGEPTAVTLSYAEWQEVEALARAQQVAKARRAAQRAARKERQKAMLRRDLTEAFAELRAAERGEIQLRSLEEVLAELEAEQRDAA